MRRLWGLQSMTLGTNVQLAAAIQPIPPVAPDTPCDIVRDLFAADRRLGCVPVVDAKRPVGLVERAEFLLQLSHLFGNALWAKQPITKLMDDAPIVVDRSMAIQEINALALIEDVAAPVRSLIVVDRGRYCGVCTPMSFLRLNAEALQAECAEALKARDQAETAMKAKSDFFARMSHELRTPLNAVIGFSEMILSEPYGPLGHGKYTEFLGDVAKSGKHLLGLVDDILSLSRLESGCMELRDETVAATALIRDAIRICEPMAQDKAVSIVTHVTEVPALRVDPARFLQILLNLLSNAIKYTGSGDAIEISLALLPCGGAEIGVKDHGPGIEADVLHRVLEPYWRDEAALVSTIRGTGLGLPIARQIAELHGGTLHLASVVGEGTRATVALPADRVVQEEKRAVA